MKIIKRNNLDISKWSGGTTTELFIMPDSANYSDREFDVRVSTATVSVKESDFSPLAGIQRHLMILEGEMTLIHEGQYEKALKSYEQDSFLGDYVTKSKSMSTVVDFNLMIQGPFLGSITHHKLNGESIVLIKDDKENLQHKGFYCHLGKAFVTVDGNKESIEQGDYVVINASELSNELKFIGEAELIEVTVWSE